MMAESERPREELAREIAELREQIARLHEIEAKKSETDKKLLDEERFLFSIFSSVQDGINVLDQDMNVIMVNPKMEEWYGHTRPLVGKKCYAAYHGRTEPCETCPTVKTMETGRASHDYLPRRNQHGDT